MPQFPFLSDEWVEETKRIRENFRDQVPEVPVSVRMNQIIQDAPFGDGVLHGHLDTTSGQLVVEKGHLDNPDLTITLTYETAKAILVDGDAQAAMNAFMSGRIKVDGDISKLIALQTAGAGAATNPATVDMFKQIQEMTA